jgi:hypothetical protein
VLRPFEQEWILDGFDRHPSFFTKRMFRHRRVERDVSASATPPPAAVDAIHDASGRQTSASQCCPRNQACIVQTALDERSARTTCRRWADMHGMAPDCAGNCLLLVRGSTRPPTAAIQAGSRDADNVTADT